MIWWRGGIGAATNRKQKDDTRKRKTHRRGFPILLLFSLTGNLIALLTFCKFYNFSVPDAKFNLTRLKTDLRAEIFGQDEAINLLVDEMSKYLDRDHVTPSMPLMISVHGSGGTGKTKLTNHLIDFLPRACANKFIVPLHFVRSAERFISLEELMFVPNYCEFALVIFEEMDFATDSFLDALKTDLRERSTRTIILFTSDVGTTGVVDFVRWRLENNDPRENITQNEVSQLVRNSWHDRDNQWLKSLKFVVFLPMDKQNVRKCINSQLNRAGLASPKIVNYILENINFLPKSQLIAGNGCKNIDSYIKMFL